MAAANSCRVLWFGYPHSDKLDRPTRSSGPVSWLPISKSSMPNTRPSCEALQIPKSGFMNIRCSQLTISYGIHDVSGRRLSVRRISCLSDDNYGEHPGSSDKSQQEATIDVKLPRRSLLVTFTCDVCCARSQRLINRHAYERGLVYIQCSGCSRYHKLVDNLELVIEYNLQEEIDLGARTDQM